LYICIYIRTHPIFDGLNDIPRLIKRLKEIGATACAITDHGNMHNVLKFYRACIENDIKPILGFEAYISIDRRLQKKEQFDALVAETGDDFVRESAHLVLLAKNFTGYQNLLKLTTIGYTQGFYRRPHIDFEDLRAHSEGVICINGHVGTDIAKAFERFVRFKAEGNLEAAEREFLRAYELSAKYHELFGEDYYLEIQDHGLKIENDTSPLMIQLAETTGVPLVITNDAHYTWESDAEAHRVHMSNGIKRTLAEFMNSDFEGFKDCDEFYVKSPDEMFEVAKRYGPFGINALHETVLVANKCNVDIDALVFSGTFINAKGKLEGKWKQKDYLFPNFPIPAPYVSMEEYFKKLAREGLADRKEKAELYGFKFGTTLDEYEKRLEYEIQVILDMGFPTYFLILWDVLRFCREQDIPVGKGRGSGAGSLVLYSLRITDVDPLPYNLIFERFLNPHRISMPDVDTDFCYDRIDEVIEYVKEKYGNEYVCKIGTFGTLGAKVVLKDVARVMEYPFDKINALTRKVTDIGIDLDKIIEKYPDFKDAYTNDEGFQRIFNVAKRLEGLQRHTSQHAAGVVISPFPLVNLIPLKGGYLDLTSQWEMHDIELLGFVKMDFLKLRTLTVIKNTLNSIERQIGTHIDIDKIDLEDPRVYEEFQKGNSVGIFQFESSGMQALLKRHKPKSIDDLAADNALYRPGPMDAKVEDESSPHFGKTMMDIYVERVSGLAEIAYDHPLLKDVQAETYGVFVYQEQVMKGSVALAGFSLPESDELRKVVGKKLMDKMPEQHKKFVDGCMQNPAFTTACEKDPLAIAEMIWKQIETFGRYGFNRSHSTAYAIMAYQSMYLKVYYPVYFMASVLTSWMDKKIEQIIPYLNESRVMGIQILQPDINHSTNRFEVSKDEKGIHFGLTGIKGVGDKAVENMLMIKSKHKINSLLDFITLTNSSVNRTVVIALIKCGAFDFLGLNRKTLIYMAQELIELNSKIKQKIKDNAKRKKPVSDVSLFFQPLLDFQPEMLEEFGLKELCDMEKELTGFYMKHHPLNGVVEYVKSKATNTSLEINKGIRIEHEISYPVVGDNDIEDFGFTLASEDALDDEDDIYIPLPKGQTVITGGVITKLDEIVIKNGRSKGKVMASFIIEDAYQGDIKCTAFPETYSKFINTIRVGNIIFIMGNIDYYRESAQVNVNTVQEISRDVANKYNVHSSAQEITSRINAVNEEIKMIEETLEYVGDDIDSVNAFYGELLRLYEERDTLEQRRGEVMA
jgi:DNA polymerase-3 subunit alpha